jgi:predicted aldo/keto reductase-like oxidoreductase
MKFKKLGHTDLKVSTVCLGTMTWGEQNNEDEAFRQMDMAYDYGVNFLILQNFIQFHQALKHKEKQVELFQDG